MENAVVVSRFFKGKGEAFRGFSEKEVAEARDFIRNFKNVLKNLKTENNDFKRSFLLPDINSNYQGTIKLKLNLPTCDISFKIDPDIDPELCYFNLLNLHKLPPPEFVPPRSPHNLLEEVLYRDPWALLVATIFLNKTSCSSARPYVFLFLAENCCAGKIVGKTPEDLEKYFRNLGLVRRRAYQVWRMSLDYLEGRWKKVEDLYGIGHYGECAYRIFCLGDFEIKPRDRFLKIYKEWYKKIGKYTTSAAHY